MNTGKKKKIVEGVQYRLLSLLCFVLIIGFWCVASYGHLVQEVFLPSPTAVLSRLVSMAADGSLWAHCRESIARVMIGWIWSVIVALPMGMLMANSKRFSAFVQPIIEFARYLPVVALVPLTLLYLGIAESQKEVYDYLSGHLLPAGADGGGYGIQCGRQHDQCCQDAWRESFSDL